MANRTKASFAINNFNQFKQQMLIWANQFNICCFLDNHHYQTKHNNIECLLAVNAVKSFINNKFEDFKIFEAKQNDWLFGHVSYDYKNEIHSLTSSHPDGIGFPTIFFFVPETVIELTEISVTISCINNNPNAIFEQILAFVNQEMAIGNGELEIEQPQSINNNQQSITNPKPQTPISFPRPTSNEKRVTTNEKRTTSNKKQETSKQQQETRNPILPRIPKEKYLQTIEQLQKHILRGDCYEINFCQEFFAENYRINPIQVYQKLATVSPNPFSCYYKLNNQYLLCASPERYVKKEGNQIISQPIKGTFKRNLIDSEIDIANKIALQNSLKDKSENVMVVDLVRNDLSKICTEGSVKVDEIFAVYTFPQVHQMISTISGTLQPNTSFTNVLEATFPMGSMTGAPKLKVMQLTEQYEQTQRGIYSGCVGYIAPNKNFDFNVVIRSIMYNATTQYISYQVGGGITYNSNAESEYEECLLKAEAMRKVLI